jgi:hypothetical protein
MLMDGEMHCSVVWKWKIGMGREKKVNHWKFYNFFKAG